MGNRLVLGAISLILLVILTACGTNNANNAAKDNSDNTVKSGTNVTNNDVEQVKGTKNSDETTSNATPSEIPEGMKVAESPKFKVGDQVIINAEHEEGMKGSVGTIKGAYDTIVFSVSYTPTHGENPEENHKWIVQEQLKGLDEKMLEPGSKVIIESDQEEGMLGAEGVIDTAEKTVAYMVEFTQTNGRLYKKWFKESELSAK